MERIASLNSLNRKFGHSSCKQIGWLNLRLFPWLSTPSTLSFAWTVLEQLDKLILHCAQMTTCPKLPVKFILTTCSSQCLSSPSSKGCISWNVDLSNLPIRQASPSALWYFCLLFQLWLPGGGLCHVQATVAPSVIVEAGAVVQEGSRIGKGCHIGSGSVIGPGVVLGKRVLVGHQVGKAFACVLKIPWSMDLADLDDIVPDLSINKWFDLFRIHHTITFSNAAWDACYNAINALW